MCIYSHLSSSRIQKTGSRWRLEALRPSLAPVTQQVTVFLDAVATALCNGSKRSSWRTFLHIIYNSNMGVYMIFADHFVWAIMGSSVLTLLGSRSKLSTGQVEARRCMLLSTEAQQINPFLFFRNALPEVDLHSRDSVQVEVGLALNVGLPYCRWIGKPTKPDLEALSFVCGVRHQSDFCPKLFCTRRPRHRTTEKTLRRFRHFPEHRVRW